MSKTIDERVVKMEFDNSGFDKNIDASKKSLDNFNDYLNKSAKDSGGYFENLGDSANKLNFNGLIESVQNISSHFNVFGVVAKRVLEDLTDSAYRAGQQFAKSLTVEDIAKGWDKYNQKTAGVMTIMAATGKSVDDVNASLEKLNWYTDETSYNFTDMVDNIGKFTAAGVDLDDAVSAMTGIGNVASVSGQGIQQASRAMYNFAQAMGTGVVKLIDWKSIENANMATMEFKQTIIDTALELGTISETAEGVYRTLDGNEFTNASFSEQLKDGWFTGDVLVKTLKKYSAYSDEIYKIADNFDTCSEAMANFSGKGMELGEKSFKAAQEAKSFAEAIDSVHDAVSTGWMQTFEYLFGNYEESKKMWTDLANSLWDLFASPGVARNEFLADVMTSKWDQVSKAVVATGVATDDLNDKVFNVINTMLENNWYEEMAKWAVDGMMPQYESLEKLREELEFNGKTIEDYIEETGSLQDALIEAGVDAPKVMREAVEALTYEAEKAAYQVKDTDKIFSKFSDTVLDLKKAGKSTSEILAELEKAGYGSSVSIIDVKKVLAGTITSFDQLSDSTRKSIGYQDYANTAFTKFVKEAKEAAKQGNTTAEIYEILAEKGYDLSQNKQLLNKVINDEIQSYKELTKSEQNAVIWIDEQESGLREVRDGMYDVKSEIYQTMMNLTRKDARDTIVGALTRALENLVNIVNAFRDAWDAVMPKLTPDRVLDLAEGFADWLDSLALTEEELEKLQNTFEGFLTIFKIAGKVISAVISPIIKFIGTLTDVDVSLLDLSSSIADNIKEFDKWLDESGVLTEMSDKISTALEKIANAIKTVVGTIKDAVLNGENPFTAITTKIHEMIYAVDETGNIDESPLGKFGRVIGNLAIQLLTAVEKLSGVVTKYWPIVLDFFSNLIDFVYEALINFDWQKAGEKLLAFPKAIVQFAKVMSGHGDTDWRTAYPGLAAFIDGIQAVGGASIEKAKEIFNKIKEVFGKFIDWAKEKFSDMTPEDMAVLAFSAALIYMIIKIGKLAGSATNFMDNIGEFGKNIKDGFKSFTKDLKSVFGKSLASEIQKIGITIAILMGLVLAATQYDTKDLMKGVAVIGALGAIVLVIGAVFKAMSLIESKTKKTIDIKGVAAVLLGLCAGIMMIAVAVKQIQDVVFNSDIMLTMGMVTAIVTIMSLISVYMTKNAGDFSKSLGIAIVLLAMAMSINKVVVALAGLTNKDVSASLDNLSALVILMGAFGALTMMARGIKLSSALGLIIIIGVISLILQSMGDMVNEFDASGAVGLVAGFAVIAATVMYFSIVMAVLSAKGAKLGKLSAGLATIAASFVIFGAALALICKVFTDVVDLATIAAASLTLFALMTFVTVLVAISAVINQRTNDGKAFARIASGMISISSALLLMCGALAILMKLADASVAGLGVALAVMTWMVVLVAALISVAQDTEKAKTKPILAMIGALALMMAGLAILYNLKPGRLLVTALSMTLIIAALAVMVKQLDEAKLDPKGLLSLAGMLLVLTGTLYILESVPDIFQLLVVVGSLSLLMMALATMTYIVVNSSTNFDKAGKGFLGLSAALIAMSVAVSILSYMMSSGLAKPADMATAAFGLTTFVMLIGLALKAVNKIAPDASNASKSLVDIAAAVLMMGLAIGAVNLLTDQTDDIGASVGAIIAAIIGLCAGLAIVSRFGGDAKASTETVTAVAATMVVLGALFAIVQQYDVDWKKILTVGAGVAAALVALAFVFSKVPPVITRTTTVSKEIKKNPVDFKGIGTFLLSAAGAIAILAGVLVALDHIKMDPTRTITNALALGSLIVALGLAMVAASYTGRNAKKALGPLVALTVAVGLISILLIAFDKLNISSDKLALNASIIGEFLLTMSASLAIIALLKNIDDTYAPLFAMTIAVGLIGALLVKLASMKADPDSLISYVDAIGGLLISLSLSIIAINKFGSYATGSEKILWAMVACIGVIGLTLGALAAISNDTFSASDAALAIGVCLLLVAASMKSISKSYFYVQNGSKAIALMAGAILIAGGVIALVAKMSNGAGEAIAAGASIGLALYLVAKALATISLYSSGISQALPAIGVMAAAMVAAGAAIGLVATFAGDNWETLLAAALGIGLTLAVAALALSLVCNNVSGMKDAAGSIGIVMGAVLAAATALAIIGKFCGTDFADLGVAALGIGAVLLAAALSLAIMANVSRDLTSVASSIGAMIGAIATAAVALTLLSKFTDAESAIQGAIGLAVVMMAASVALLIASEAGTNAVKGAAAMAIMALALVGTAAAITSLSGYDWQSLIAAAAALAVVVVLMAVSALIASNAVTGAGAMLALAVAVVGVAGALAMLSSIDSKSLMISAATLAVFMLVLVGVGYLAEGASIGIAVIVGAIQGLSTALLLISVASVAFGAGMNLIAVACEKLQNVDMGKVAIGMMKLAAALPLMIAAFSASFIENSTTILQLVITILEMIVQAFYEIAPKLVEVIIYICQLLLEAGTEIIPQFVDFVVLVVMKLIEGARTILPEFILLVKETLNNIIAAMQEVIPRLVECGITIVDKLLQSISNHMPSIVQSGCDIIKSFIQGIADNIEDIIQAGADLITNWITGIANSSGQIIEAAFDAVITFIQGLADTLKDEKNQEQAKTAIKDLFEGLLEMAFAVLTGSWEGWLEAGKNILTKLWDGIKEIWAKVKQWFLDKFSASQSGGIIYTIKAFYEDFRSAAKHLIDGIIQGIKDKWDDLVQKFKDLAETCKNAWNKFWKIESPSKVMAESGMYIMQGAVRGINEEAPHAVDAMVEAANDMYDAFEGESRDLAQQVADDLSDGVVIKPVMDLSEVEAGADDVNNMFKDMELNFDNVNFGGLTTASIAGKVAARRTEAADVQNGTDGTLAGAAAGGVTFNQYNTSPKALSRYEIYRQTNNQLDMMKGLVAY